MPSYTQSQSSRMRIVWLELGRTRCRWTFDKALQCSNCAQYTCDWRIHAKRSDCTGVSEGFSRRPYWWIGLGPRVRTIRQDFQWFQRLPACRERTYQRQLSRKWMLVRKPRRRQGRLGRQLRWDFSKYRSWISCIEATIADRMKLLVQRLSLKTEYLNVAPTSIFPLD